MSYVYEYPRPAVTVDVVAFASAPDALRLLLIRRRHEPFAGRHALPGGFVDMDEDLETAARRELAEETGAAVGPLLEVGAFGAVHRDPRGRSIGVAFAALSLGAPPAVAASDDASDAAWRPATRLPTLAFDHRAIVAAARRRIAERIRLDGAPLALLRGPFTLDDLWTVCGRFDVDVGGRAAFAARLRRSGAVVATGDRRGRTLLYRTSSRR